MLGGCSSHNTQIYFKPFPGDWQDWVDRGAEGWDADTMEPYYQRLQTKHQIVAEKDQNPILKDWIPSAAEAARVQANPDWNAGPFRTGPASWTWATTPQPASARRRASPTCIRSWAGGPT